MTTANLPQLPPEKGSWDEKAVSRRGLLEATFGVLASAGVLAVAVPGARFLIGNALEPATPQWVEIGSIDALPADAVTRATYTTSATDAWRNVTKRGMVYVYSDDGGASYVALDGTCSHLGCMVQWRAEENRFACPCHAASFTRAGEVISGPPPKPLRSLPVKVENGVLFAQI